MTTKATNSANFLFDSFDSLPQSQGITPQEQMHTENVWFSGVKRGSIVLQDQTIAAKCKMN